jgi:uncharacterized protein (TIGR02231 family)
MAEVVTLRPIETTMNKLIIGLAMLFLSSDLFAQTGKLVESKITDVTLFLSGAQVTHEADVALKAGENILRISDLTVNLDPNSVQVEGNKDFTIINVRHAVNYLTDQSTSPKVKSVMDSLENAQFRLLEKQSLRNVYYQEREMLNANRSIKGNDAVLVTEDLSEMADFFRSRLREIEYKVLELNQDEKKLNQEIIRLQNHLNQLNARRNTNPSEIFVTVACDKAVNAKIRLNYLAYSAGWIPTYDLRSEDINQPIEMVYKAKVYQSTGNDWENVNLTLSTGNPTIGGQSPILNPWFLYLYNPQQRVSMDKMGKRDSYSQELEMSRPAAGVMMDSDMGYNGAESLAEFTVQSQNVVSTEFKIGIPCDVPADGQYYDVEMQRETLKATYDYFCAPKLDGDAFLRAKVTDWMQYSLLPGESNIYFKGTYVGKAYIDPAMANDTLDLSLGRDKSITVDRKMLSDFCKTSNLGGNTKTTKAFETSITNTKKVPVTFTLEDQIPLSQNEDITVELEESSGAALDPATGKLTWSLSIAPGETVKKQLRFSVKYPKKKLISGL